MDKVRRASQRFAGTVRAWGRSVKSVRQRKAWAPSLLAVFAGAQYALFAACALVELVGADVPREVCVQLERDAFVELELRRVADAEGGV